MLKTTASFKTNEFKVSVKLDETQNLFHTWYFWSFFQRKLCRIMVGNLLLLLHLCCSFHGQEVQSTEGIVRYFVFARLY